MDAIVSSTTSYRTSRSWCTSDPAARIGGLIRLVHPFPILLDALATGAIATLGGATPPTAVRLGAAMLALQASIGALNDLLDAARDAGRKSGKPIPRGIVGVGAARGVVIGGLVAGLALAAPSGPATILVAALGASVGYLYDLRLSQTSWSWLPFALGVPLLPLFAWLGTTGTVPPALVTLLPIGVVAGAGLALANSLADVERDAAAGKPSAAVQLGRDRAWAIQIALLASAAVLAIALLPVSRAGIPVASQALIRAVVIIGCVVLLGAALLVRRADARWRERAWEIEAIAVAVIGAAWLAAAAWPDFLELGLTIGA
ncbi:MAG TPA: UbiA family prenyltransferase [Candidatus Eisenbacteria bacterium]|nr:UbiA family prenyltransferase [Candidatus Eisenbacteria bacterium]